MGDSLELCGASSAATGCAQRVALRAGRKQSVYVAKSVRLQSGVILAAAMETPIRLRYPNGRGYDTTLDRLLLPGEQFEMYGRTWTALRATQERRQRASGPAHNRMVCVTVETPPQTNKRT
jgi:hypothetical protein